MMGQVMAAEGVVERERERLWSWWWWWWRAECFLLLLWPQLKTLGTQACRPAGCRKTYQPGVTDRWA